MQHNLLPSDPAHMEERSRRPDGEAPHNHRAPHPGASMDPEPVSLYDAFQQIWAGRRTLLLAVGAFVLAGVVFLAGSRSEYDSGAVLLPEKQEDTPANLGLLGQLGGLLGSANLGNLLRSQNAFPVELYPEILRSTPVQLALLDHRVYVPARDTTVTLFTYLDAFQPFSLWATLESALVHAPSRLRRRLADRPLPTAVTLDSTIVRLSLHQQEVLQELRDRMDVRFDARAGVLHVSVTMPDPHVAAQTAEAAVDHLTAYVTRYRMKKQTQNLAFIQERHDEAHDRFNASLNALARFHDRNQNLTRHLARTEEQRLQAEYDLAFNVYNSLASRLEEARIQVQERTPVFQVLQPVTLPLQKSYPPTLLTLLLCALLGFSFGAGYLFLRPELRRIQGLMRGTQTRDAAPHAAPA